MHYPETESIIKSIEKFISSQDSKFEIGAGSEPQFQALLKANNISSEYRIFQCSRKISNSIIRHFRDKGIPH